MEAVCLCLRAREAEKTALVLKQYEDHLLVRYAEKTATATCAPCAPSSRGSRSRHPARGRADGRPRGVPADVVRAPEEGRHALLGRPPGAPRSRSVKSSSASCTSAATCSRRSGARRVPAARDPPAARVLTRDETRKLVEAPDTSTPARPARSRDPRDFLRDGHPRRRARKPQAQRRGHRGPRAARPARQGKEGQERPAHARGRGSDRGVPPPRPAEDPRRGEARRCSSSPSAAGGCTTTP